MSAENEKYAGSTELGNALAKGVLLANVGFIGKVLGGGAGLLTLGGAISGGIWGYNQASAAQKQHHELRETIRELHTENTILKAEAKWAERMVTRNSNLKHTTDRGI